MTTDNQNDEIAALKNQLFILLVSLIAVTGTLTAVLYRQASITNKDLTQAIRLSAQIHTNEMVIGSFVGRLEDYARKHPDFIPVLKKSGLALPPGAPAAPAPKK